MVITINYQNALTEVYEILKTLKIEDLNKIPEDLISVIEKNRNMEYIYTIDSEINLKNQKMLPETKAILFNLYRDYLSSPEQKEKIKKIQAEERRKIELSKKNKYSSQIFIDKSKINNTELKQNQMIDISNKKWYKKILQKIKSFLGKLV